MKLVRLSLTNWKAFEDSEWQFTDGINIIEGDNYSGKTSFIQAIYYGFFGEMLYNEQLSASKLRRVDGEDTRIELDFKVGEKTYRIKRNIEGNKRIYVNSYLYPIDEHGNEGMVIDEHSHTEKQKLGDKEDFSKLDGILPVSTDFLKHINFIQEESIYLFLGNPNLAVDEDINNILKLNYIKKLIKFSDEKIKIQESIEKELKEKKKNYDDFLAENNSTITFLEGAITEKNENINKIQGKIEEKQKKVELVAELKDKIKEKDRITHQVSSLEKQRNDLAQELEGLQDELDDITKLEDKIEELKRIEALRENNETKIKEFQTSLKSLQSEVQDAEVQKKLLEQHKKTKAEDFAAKQSLQNEISRITDLKKEIAVLKKKKDEFENIANKLAIIERKIRAHSKMSDQFKEKKCPVDKKECPVAETKGKVIDDKLTKFRNKKSEIQASLNILDDPHDELKSKESELQLLEKKQDNLETINTKLSQLTDKIKEIKEKLREKEGTEDKVKDIETKIAQLEKINETNSDSHDEYVRINERIKDKPGLIEKIESKKESMNANQSELETSKKELEACESNISSFKDDKGLTTIPDIDALETEISNLEGEIKSEQEGKIRMEAQLDQLKKSATEILTPYSSKTELEKSQAVEVHKLYKALYYKECLAKTMKELKDKKYREIKDQCSKMWAAFKGGTILDTISWDDDFIPYIQTGGNKRTIFQLSASEKIMIYFSIRASLLAKLGLNLTLIADNLLISIMEDNKNTVMDLLAHVIDNTDVEQILFTGFDFPHGVRCQNKILLSK